MSMSPIHRALIYLVATISLLSLPCVSTGDDTVYNAGLRILDFPYVNIKGVSETITLAVWYPTETAPDTFVYRMTEDFPSQVALNAPHIAGGPHPLVVYVHGAYSSGYSSSYFTEYLAKRGYIVVAPDYVDLKPPDYRWRVAFSTIKDGKLTPTPVVLSTAQAFVDHINEDREFLLAYLEEHRLHHTPYILDRMLELNEDKDSIFHNTMKSDAVGAVGYSLGGMTVLAKIGAHPEPGMLDSRFRAALLFSSPAYPFEGTLDKIQVPIMIMAGEHDEPNAGPDIPRELVFDEAKTTKYLLELVNADHYAFSNSATPPLSLDIASESDPKTNAICRYGTAFFNAHLKHRTEPAGALSLADPSWTSYQRVEALGRISGLIVRLSSDAAKIQLTWEQDANATAYNIYRQSGLPITETASLSPLQKWVPGPTAIDSQVGFGQAYHYAVTSVGALGEVESGPVASHDITLVATGFGGTVSADGVRLVLPQTALPQDQGSVVSITILSKAETESDIRAQITDADARIVGMAIPTELDTSVWHIVGTTQTGNRVDALNSPAQITFPLGSSDSGRVHVFTLTDTGWDLAVSRQQHTRASGTITVPSQQLGVFRLGMLNALGRPTDLQARVSRTGPHVALQWTSDPNAVSYNIYRQTALPISELHDQALLLGSVTGSSVTDTQVVLGNTYYYAAASVGYFGEPGTQFSLSHGITLVSIAVGGTVSVSNVTIGLPPNALPSETGKTVGVTVLPWQDISPQTQQQVAEADASTIGIEIPEELQTSVWEIQGWDQNVGQFYELSDTATLDITQAEMPSDQVAVFRLVDTTWVLAAARDYQHQTTESVTSAINALGVFRLAVTKPVGNISQLQVRLAPNEVAAELQWLAATNAVAYNVYRRSQQPITATTGLTPILTNVIATNAIDRQLLTSTTYYYAVSALDSYGDESAEIATTHDFTIVAVSDEGNVSAEGVQLQLQKETLSSVSGKYASFTISTLGEMDPSTHQAVAFADMNSTALDIPEELRESVWVIDGLTQQGDEISVLEYPAELSLPIPADVDGRLRAFLLTGTDWELASEQQTQEAERLVTSISSLGVFRLGTYTPLVSYPWDVNQDNAVDILDLTLVGIHFGETGPSVVGDVNGDGSVDILDLSQIGLHFGETYGSQLAPSTTSFGPLAKLEMVMEAPTPSGETRVGLSVDSLEPIRGFHIQLEYDPDLLDVVEVREGDAWSAHSLAYWLPVGIADGRISVAAALLRGDPAPMSTMPPLIQIVFRNRTGSLHALESLRVLKVQLANSQAQEYPAEWASGFRLHGAVDALGNNYPNPFNPETWIPYSLAQDSDVQIRVYDLLGRLVRTLDLGRQSAGWYHLPGDAARWDGRSMSGERVGSGTFFYELVTQHFRQTKRMVIVK